MLLISKIPRCLAAFLYIPVLIVSVSSALVQAKGGDLHARVHNPISSLISLPFKFTFDYGASNGEDFFCNIRPAYPVTVGDWNLFSRLIVPLIDSPGAITTPDTPYPIPGDGATLRKVDLNSPWEQKQCFI